MKNLKDFHMESSGRKLEARRRGYHDDLVMSFAIGSMVI